MIGIAVGIIAGAIQYWLLAKFTARIARGGADIRTVLLGLAQFFLPLGVLIGMAFIRRQELLTTAIGITVILLFGAVGKVLLRGRQTSGRGEGDHHG